MLLRKTKLSFRYFNNLGPRLRNDLDLKLSHLLPTFRSQAATVSKVSIVFTFPHIQTYVSKTDLAVLVKVILPRAISFEQSTMGWSPRTYIPSFVKMDPPVLEKKTFEHFRAFVSMAAMLSIRPRPSSV